jgi:transglutaminase-like putative cysteine protease
MTPGSISRLGLSDAIAFRAEFRGSPPPPAQRYWRGPVLTTFDGQTWRPAPFTVGAQPAYAPAGPAYDYRVTLEPHNQHWLLALDFPGAGLAGARYASDYQLLADRPLQIRSRFDLRAYPATAIGVDENAQVLAAARRLPGDSNPRTRALGRQLAKGAASPQAVLERVLGQLRARALTYTLSPPLLGRDAIDAFLFDARRGFCEHFSSAFVFLMRAAGVPARVVTGYQGGEINPVDGSLVVRQSDAHAWTEVLVDGAWRRVDPTGAVAPSRIEMGLSRAVAAGEPVPLFARLDGGWLKDAQLTLDALNHAWRRHLVGFNRDRQRELWRELTIDRYAGWQIAVIAGAIGLVWAGIMLAATGFARARREREQALWHEACTRLARAGLPRLPHEGPLAYATRASRRWPQFAIAFAAIAESYAALRYGPPPARPGEREALVATLARAVDVLPSPGRLRSATA